MKNYKRSAQWFDREYKYLRQDADCRIAKNQTSESYMTDIGGVILIYDLYFDKNGSYIGSTVSNEHGNVIANYELR